MLELKALRVGLMVLSPVSPYIHKVRGPARLRPLVGREEGACRVGPVIRHSDPQRETGPSGISRSIAITLAHSPSAKGGVGHSPAQRPGEIGAQPCQEAIPVSRSALSFISESQIVCATLSPSSCDSWFSSKEVVVPITQHGGKSMENCSHQEVTD